MTLQKPQIDRHTLLYEHAARTPSTERATQMVDIYLQYLRCWFDGNYAGMLERLVDEPVFEHYPQRLKISGREAVQARAQRLLGLAGVLDPRAAGGSSQTRAVGFGEDVMVCEFMAPFTLGDGTTRPCRLATVVVFKGDRIYGERVYTDRFLNELVDAALGEDFSHLRGVADLGDDGGRVPDGLVGATGPAPAPVEPLECPSLSEAALRLPSLERANRLVEANIEYAEHFFNGTFEPMMDCLVDEPVFEQHPRGIEIRGREAVFQRNSRSHSSGGMKQLDPRAGADTHHISASCVGEDLLIHEFSNVFTLPDGSSRRCYLLAIIPYVGDRLVGERVYTDRLGELRTLARHGDDFLDVPGVTLL